MPENGCRKPPEYLRAARVKAGCVNRSTAAMKVPYSPETIGRHERGEVDVEPEDAVIYAEGYKCPDILFRYCAECPVGIRTGRAITERPLPHAVLRARRMIEDAQEPMKTLERIAMDGKVDSSERQDFGSAVSFLKAVETAIVEILLLGALPDIDKTAPDRASRAV